MARLIDADKLIKTSSGIKIAIYRDCDPYEAIRIQGDAFRKAVEKAQTVDAVEVVRCNDCKYWEKFQSSLLGEVMCCIAQGEMNVQKDPYDFCSYGERRTDG